jgi:thioesterase DpgC
MDAFVADLLSEDDTAALLRRAGFDQGIVEAWIGATPAPGASYDADVVSFSRYWSLSADLLARLPAKPSRDTTTWQAAEAVKHQARAARFRFLGRHVRAVYDRLTAERSRFVRVEDLVVAAAALIPGLVPAPCTVAAESALRQADKDGHEIDQGIFLNQVLADPVCGQHLCHAMLLPRGESREALGKLRRDGTLDLGPARVERRGRAAVLTLDNQRFLNAEDDATLVPMEIAADVCILDPDSDIAVLRGSRIEGGKYAGRRVFNAGINLTHLYYGKIPFLWYLRRDLGFVNKFARGVAKTYVSPDEVSGDSIEKLWVCAVDTLAIGGGCQILLACDYTVAARGAYMTLPARKEGIIPAMANLRLARFVGDRIARQAIMYERRIDCDSPEGRLIVDEVVEPDEMEAAIDRIVGRLGGSGIVSAASNRRAFRVSLEPLDLFRRYAAVYAREQAYCHFSPALIDNLERYWDAQNRRV